MNDGQDMSDKTRIRRLPERGVSDEKLIYAILDAGLLCHVAYVVDTRPVIIPTLYVRDHDRLLIHGSNSMGISRAVRGGSPLSVAVTHLDGLVVARSSFNSSANYRSVVAHGVGKLLDGEEKRAALQTIVDRLIPRRRSEIRVSTETEVAQTSVIALLLDEVSAKVRTGPPGDDEADLDTRVWAGVIPFGVSVGEPIPAPELDEDINLPDYLRNYQR